ncbi:hypothetical protein C8Q70DRAFT_1053861 [Cubamyces menziesii]|nr:hypothetical protein C8Q70DRAFT_1053861 [Cubamyces menziesii]
MSITTDLPPTNLSQLRSTHQPPRSVSLSLSLSPAQGASAFHNAILALLQLASSGKMRSAAASDAPHSASRFSGHWRRSPPVVYWNAVMGNPSSIYVAPDGSVIASDGPAVVEDPVSPAPMAGSSGVPDLDPNLQASGSTPASSAPVQSQASTGTQSQISSSATVESATSASSAQSLVPPSSISSSALATISSSAATSVTETTSATASSTATTPTPSSSLSTSSSSSVPTSSSATPTSTASGGATPPKIDSASSSENANRSTSFYIGIAFAAIACAGLVVTILAWWLRIRSRTRRRKKSKSTAWPWDHDQFGGRQLSLEGGLGIYEPDRDMVERPLHPGAHSPIAAMHGTLADPSTYTIPVPPPPAHTQRAHGSPYVTVQLHDAHQSVPDLAPDLGTLQITNLAPGDMYDSSRASTALGVAHTYPAEYGTPFQPQRPCFLGVQSGGLEVPWRPLRIRRNGSAASGQRGAPLCDTESLNEPLPYPGDIAVSDDSRLLQTAAGQRHEGWAASIRSNLLNAFNAVVGANPSQVSAPNDTFTQAPTRHSQRSKRSIPHGPREHLSKAHGSSWTLEETGDGAGVVHIRNGEEDAAGDVPAQDPFADDLQIPPLAATASQVYGSGLLCVSPPASVTRASSMYSTASDTNGAVERVRDGPPRLPSIPSLSRSQSEDNTDEQQAYDGIDVQTHRVRGQRRKKTKNTRRPLLASRKSSSQNSTNTIGSDMSRTSSACSEHLTDGERFAKNALRERRRRVMEMTVGRGKTRRSRATTLSRRVMGSRALNGASRSADD